MTYVNLLKSIRADFSYAQKQKALDEAWQIMNKGITTTDVKEEKHEQLSIYDYLRKKS